MAMVPIFQMFCRVCWTRNNYTIENRILQNQSLSFIQTLDAWHMYLKRKEPSYRQLIVTIAGAIAAASPNA